MELHLVVLSCVWTTQMRQTRAKTLIAELGGNYGFLVQVWQICRGFCENYTIVTKMVALSLNFQIT